MNPPQVYMCCQHSEQTIFNFYEQIFSTMFLCGETQTNMNPTT